jgi:four helix bundle protein
MKTALSAAMRARSVEELQVYQKTLIAADEISAILKRESFRSDWRLRAQLGGSSESVPALIAEGFSQKTDRHFAELLYRSRGESSETRTHLRAARTRDHISSKDLEQLTSIFNEIEKMLTGLIKHLHREDRRVRG